MKPFTIRHCMRNRDKELKIDQLLVRVCNSTSCVKYTGPCSLELFHLEPLNMSSKMILISVYKHLRTPKFGCNTKCCFSRICLIFFSSVFRRQTATILSSYDLVIASWLVQSNTRYLLHMRIGRPVIHNLF